MEERERLWASQSLGEGPASGGPHLPLVKGAGVRAAVISSRRNGVASPHSRWACGPRAHVSRGGHRGHTPRHGQEAPEAQLLTISTRIVQVKTVPVENVASGPWNVLRIGVLLVGLGLAWAPGHGLSATLRQASLFHPVLRALR